MLLTSKDRANGFSIVGDESHNITLLKEGRPMAWFSRIVSEKTVNAFVELIKDSESRMKRVSIGTGMKRDYSGDGAAALDSYSNC